MYLRDPANQIMIYNNRFIVNEKFGRKIFTLEGQELPDDGDDYD
jgi:hypothetical protein